MTTHPGHEMLSDRYHIVSVYQLDDGQLLETTEGGSARKAWAMNAGAAFAKGPLNIDGLKSLHIYDRMARQGAVMEWAWDFEAECWKELRRRPWEHRP